MNTSKTSMWHSVRHRAATRLIALAMITANSLGCEKEPTGPVLSGGRELKSWVADLNHRSPKVRRTAVLKLGNVGAADGIVVESLTKALDDPDTLVRRDAIMGIVKLKTPTPAILNRLENLSKSEKDPSTKEHAKQAMAHFQDVP